MKKKLNKGFVTFNYIHPEKETLFFRVPIQWNAYIKKWTGSIEITDTDLELHVSGTTNEEFHRSFVEEINKLLFIYPNVLEHIHSMCMPAWYWEEDPH